MQTQCAGKIANLGPALILAALLPLLLVSPVAAVGVLDLAWTEPTTNNDGSQLIDLSSYRIYVGTSSGPCPGPFFMEIPSSTPAPTGMEVTHHLTGLNAGEIYFVQVTAVDASGNESVCSNEASGQARDNPGVNPVPASGENPVPASGGGGGGGGCFIATAAFGSPLAPQVHLLRNFRDRHLLPYSPGQALVHLYYRLSPPFADIIAGSDTLRAIVRFGLLPILAWTTLVLWSPPLGLAALLLTVGLLLWPTLLLLRKFRVRRSSFDIRINPFGSSVGR